MSNDDHEAYIPALMHAPDGLPPFHLNGTQDVLSLFELMPLYDRAVRPYLRPDVGPYATEAEKAAANTKRATIPKTYWHYVKDLPGKTRMPKRLSSSRMHQELTDILMKPEYTYTQIVPLDAEVTHAAFNVDTSSGLVQGIDYTQLEAEEPEAPPSKKNKNQASDRTDAPKKRVVLINKKKRV